MYNGARVANAIRSGAFDSAAGFSGNSNGDAAEYMNSSEYESKFYSQQDIYREALAAYAKAASSGGKAKGEIAYYDYLEKNLKNN